MEEIEDKEFEGLSYSDHIFTDMKINHCVFRNCNFENVVLKNSVLSANKFENCTIMNPHAEFSEMTNSIFKSCNLIGVNWGDYRSNKSYLSLFQKLENNFLKYNSFILVDLKDFDFRTNAFHSALFEECNLSKSYFSECDLSDSQFIKSDLRKTNFTNAKNYYIDLQYCDLKGTKISMVEGLSLLSQLGIEVQ